MQLSLYWSPASPFVRKVMVCAREHGLGDAITLLNSAANPVNRDYAICNFNPLGKVPAAQDQDGMSLYDSRVICEYVDHAGGGGLFPAPGPARWLALRRQALADGLLDAAMLMRYEGLTRPEDKQWPVWVEKQGEKVTAALAEMEADVPAEGLVDIGAISFACALGWLDLRFPNLGWRETHPKLSAWQAAYDQRPAMVATRPRS